MYEVIWDVEDEVFGGTYSLSRSFNSYREASEFAEGLHHDDLVSNIEIYGGEYDE